MALNFDFMTAKLKHTQWKLHLREFLDGKSGLTAEQAISHRDCELGKWLVSVGVVKYGSVAEMKQLETEHEELHRTVKRVVDLKAAGHSAEAEAEYAKVDAVSKRLISLLNAVESAVIKRV
jgi:hypothetical protein